MLFFQTMGDSRNLPLLFLHGFLGSGRDWFGVAESLAREYFCVLVDLPGHGKTRLRWQPGDDPFRFGGRKLLAVLDTLQIDQSVLLGTLWVAGWHWPLSSPILIDSPL